MTRHLMVACKRVGVVPSVRTYEGADDTLIAFVASLNLTRRHLTESQRAMVAARMASYGHGGDRSKSPIGDLTQAQAAETMQVGKRQVERAKTVLDKGTPELKDAVDEGKIAVSKAAQIARRLSA